MTRIDRSSLYHTRCNSAALAIILSLAWTAAASAQLDNDPLNNVAATADALPLAAPGTAIFNQATFAAGGNDVDFFQVPLAAGDVLLGMTVPIANLPTGFDVPDTIAAIFDGPTMRTFSDDDGANDPTVADIRGSLFRFRADRSGIHHIGVSGFYDVEFDGAASGNVHEETGAYRILAGRVNRDVLGGGFTDTDPANQTTAGADLIVVPPTTHATVAVSRLLANDVDFYRLDLSAGDVLAAMTAPLTSLPTDYGAPDTMLGLFNSGGTLLLLDDDSGDTGNDADGVLASDHPFVSAAGNTIFGSALRAEITTSGTYYLGVTGFGDNNFVGTHGESGSYALLVGVPEPSTVVLLVTSLAALAIVRQLRRQH
jgi:hypothetical protein